MGNMRTRALLALGSFALASGGFVACVGGDDNTDGGADAVADNTVVDAKTDSSQDATPDVVDAAPDVNPFAKPCMAITLADAGADAAPTLVDGGAIAPIQTFANGMFGCPGKLDYPNRADLCNAAENCHVCTAKEWISNVGNVSPTHQYWVDDSLGFAGGGPPTDCFAGAIQDGGVMEVCSPTTDPMRVCKDGPLDAGVADAAFPFMSTDNEGNICNWTGCDYIADAGSSNAPDAQTRNLHFGGCYGDPTAGALCCCK